MTWFTILAAVALPFWLSAVALAAHQLWEAAPRRLRTSGPAAGTWLEAMVRRVVPGVRVEVHDQPGMDAYWPGVDAIGLSRGTAEGTGPVQRAIAAHELGHAVNLHAHPSLRHVLPGIRLVESWAWRGFGASLLACALLGMPGAAIPTAIFAVAAAVASLGVLADEGMASVRAARWLEADLSMTAHEVGIARRSMAHSWSVYATRTAGQLAVLGALPTVLPMAVSMREVRTVTDIDPVGAWILVAALPFLALRVGQVLAQVWQPEPVGSDFRLFTVMHREAQWESLTGFAVLAVLFGLHDHASGWVFAASAGLAAMVALEPVSALGRALILLPVLLGLRKWSQRTEADDEALFGDMQPGGAVPALMALYTRPPWYLRASWFTSLAWVPMVGLLCVQLLSMGWWPA